MSNYPCGLAGPRQYDAEYRCHNCGFTFTVQVINDLGDVYAYDENDEKCHECGSLNTEVTYE